MARRKATPPPSIEIRDDQREQLAVWMKEKFAKIEEEHEQRIEILKTVGEHPSPIFDRMVKNFAMLGINRTLIAKMLNISYGTLMTHYADTIDLGTAEANAMVASSMLKIAADPDHPQAGKVGMGWLDRRGGPDWAPATKKIEFEDKTQKTPVIDSARLTYEERAQLRDMILRIGKDADQEDLIDGDKE